MYDAPIGLVEHGEMAKKKPEPPADRPKSRQDIILVYKADPSRAAEVKEWLRELADDLGLPVANVFDVALKELGRQRKLRPMPKRQVR
jgi:hypothetical protein